MVGWSREASGSFLDQILDTDYELIGYLDADTSWQVCFCVPASFSHRDDRYYSCKRIRGGQR